MSVFKIGDYTVTRTLGQGGMGKVFQAISPQGATVAIKTMILSEGLDARTRWETVERFQREARAARSLVHPNIVQVVDIGADQETFFIVMEFLDGQSIRELVALAGALKVDRAVEIMLSACEALSYAHGQGVVHRDIKPDNIMVLRNGTVKLTDFGLAAIITEKGLTQTGTIMGTLAYMSPEQARGEKLDVRSDIFSLGATFWEMLSGKQLYQGETAVVLTRILNEDPPSIPSLPPHVSRTVNRCLRKRPEHRYQTVREMIESLRMAAATDVPGTTLQRPGTQVSAPAPPGAPPGTQVSHPAAGATPPSTQVSRPAATSTFRCGKCREPMSQTAASCWKCGTPNPLLKQRTQQQKSQQEILDALRGSQPPKKSGWWKKGK